VVGRPSTRHGVRRESQMDSFLKACGATGPLTLRIEGPGPQAAETVVLAQPFAMVGRNDRADLTLDHDLVSRRHAFLQMIEGKVFYIDMGSRTGSAVGDSPSEWGWVGPGQGLRVGPYTLRLPGAGAGAGAGAVDPPAANPLLSRSSERADLPRVSLAVQSLGNQSHWQMSPVLTLVGSSPRCKIKLGDSRLSKFHCALLRTPGGLWAVDLLGRGGVTLNGRPVRAARVGPGDVLGMGLATLRPGFEGPPQDGAASTGLATGVWSNPPARIEPQAGFPVVPAGIYPPAHPPDALTADALPAGLGQSVGGEPALSLLLNHFGQMQQQMANQFQQSMMMMMQMFGGMHQDQMGLVREELDRLRELTSEIQSIKSQLAERPAPAPNPPPFYRPAGADPYRGGNGFATPPGPRPDPHPHPYPGQRPPVPSSSAPPTAPAAPASADDSSGEVAAVKYPAMTPEAGVHDWLSDRLTTIEQEQQSRWQKIVSLLKSDK